MDILAIRPSNTGLHELRKWVLRDGADRQTHRWTEGPEYRFSKNYYTRTKVPQIVCTLASLLLLENKTQSETDFYWYSFPQKNLQRDCGDKKCKRWHVNIHQPIRTKENQFIQG